MKKGSPLEKSNYRPVSCLAVASKVLEKIVCDQVTKFMEILTQWFFTEYTEISMKLEISGFMDLFLWNLPTTNGG